MHHLRPGNAARAGIDVLSDGEYRRGGWSEAWTASLDGLVANEGSVVGLPANWRGGYLDMEASHLGPEAGNMAPPGRLIVGDKLKAK
jgi:hypothetical protein